MATVTGVLATAETTREQALTRLLSTMHDAGIAQDDPVGVLLMQLFETTTFASTNMVNAQVKLWETMARCENEVARVRADLASGRAGIEQLKLVGEQNIKAWETIAERERQASINNVIEGLVVDLKPRLYEKLVELLPAAERDFYAAVKFRLWGWIALSSLVVLIAGIGVGFSLNWHNRAVAGYCEAHQHHDPHGENWCFLP